MYTERYMGTPKDNVNGYRDSSLLARAKQLQHVHYLLIHGTGDGMHSDLCAALLWVSRFYIKKKHVQYTIICT